MVVLSTGMPRLFHCTLGVIFFCVTNVEPWFEAGGFSGLADNDCGGEVIAGRSPIESPGFPQSYSPDLDCRWRVRTVPGWKINVTSQYFSIEDQAACLWDFLEIKDGDHDGGRMRYCGNERVSFISSSDVIRIVFQTDTQTSGIGFKLFVTPVQPENVTDYCNTTLIDETGSITSPYYPLPYPSNSFCSYLIQGPPKSHVVLYVEDFEVETSPCDFDHVTMHDGPSSDSPRLATLCGKDVVENMTSSTNNLLIVFTSDSALETSGFNITYKILYEVTTTTPAPTTTTTTHSPEDANCSIILENQEGNFSSPGYPAPYPLSTQCVTYIRATRLSTIVVNFLTFDLEASEDCSYDFVTIKGEGNRTEKENYTICGRNPTQTVFTFETTLVTVTLNSDTSLNAQGYFAHYIISPLKKDSACPLQCNNGGSCVFLENNATQERTWRCDCSLGFAGNECEFEDTVTCDNYACHNGGTCYIQNGQPTCHCLPEYTDHGCQTRRQLPSDQVTFTKIPHNMTVARGSGVVLECSVKESNVQIMWLHHDRILSEGSHSDGFQVHPGGVLHIPEVGEEQDGKYSCIALSGGNLVEMSAWIALTEPCKLRVVKAPRNTTVEEGGSVILQCFVPGAKHTLWRKDGEFVKLDRRKKMLVNNYLSLDNIMETDAGDYTCSTRGSNGCTARVSATVTVEGIGHKKACGRPRIQREKTRVGRIASGKEVGEGETPWHVIIRDKRHNTAFCGGSMINTEWFLTAAHCVSQFEEFYLYPFSKQEVDIYIGTVRCDGKQGIHRRLKEYILHPNFNGANFDNDIALFRLDQPVDISDLVIPICLERDLFVNELLRGGRLGMITGCGSLYEDGMAPTFLREVSIPYVNRPLCERSARKVNASFTDGMICAGYTRSMRGDACHGDSGGPYVMKYGGRWIQVGIVSWGVGCDRENQYGYYTRVSKYYDWILNNSVEGSPKQH